MRISSILKLQIFKQVAYDISDGAHAELNYIRAAKTNGVVWLAWNFQQWKTRHQERTWNENNESSAWLTDCLLFILFISLRLHSALPLSPFPIHSHLLYVCHMRMRISYFPVAQQTGLTQHNPCTPLPGDGSNKFLAPKRKQSLI